MDFCKAYDCIPHELLIAKSKCYGIENGSLGLLLDYLTNRKQRTKTGSSFSLWCDIDTGVPQGSIVGQQSQKSVILRMITHYTVAIKI